MTIDKGIPIKNIYYMLSYAFKDLKHNNYERIDKEKFDNIYDLYAAILSLGISYLLKHGLHKEYILKTECLTTLRGKMDFPGTIREKLARRQRLACEYDELSPDNLFNQILKITIKLLLGNKDVNKARKVQLRKVLIFFDNISEIDIKSIRWKELKYDRNSRTYDFLHSLCYFVIQEELLTTESGNVKMPAFMDEHMEMLFQRFLMAYYKRHHAECHPQAKQVLWNLDDDLATPLSILPTMNTDVTLQLGDRTLIMDAKYYTRNLQENFGKQTISSPNLYQIYTYVTNEDMTHSGHVDGMLVYAHTSDEVQPFGNITLNDGNKIMFRTLDLSQDFNKITEQLEDFIKYLK